jgi:hypothetical protein
MAAAARTDGDADVIGGDEVEALSGAFFSPKEVRTPNACAARWHGTARRLARKLSIGAVERAALVPPAGGCAARPARCVQCRAAGEAGEAAAEESAVQLVIATLTEVRRPARPADALRSARASPRGTPPLAAAHARESSHSLRQSRYGRPAAGTAQRFTHRSGAGGAAVAQHEPAA